MKPDNTSTTAAPAASATQTQTAAPATVSSNAAQYGGTLRVIESAAAGTPIGWIPETAGTSVRTMSMSLQFLLTERLDGECIPNLAESYDVDTESETPSITFHLRKGVKFMMARILMPRLLNGTWNGQSR
jgi:ABC-type transport system substrate-binding protein